MKKKPVKKTVSLEACALKLITAKHKIKKPILVDSREDHLESGDKIHLFTAVDPKDANGSQFSVVLDASGGEVEIHGVTKADSPYFKTADLAVAVPGIAVPRTAVSINPRTNDLTLNEGDVFSEIIKVTIPPNAGVTKADIYFLADTTSSMTASITAVKTGTTNILTALSGLGLDLAFGVGNYRDFPYGAYAFQHQLNPTSTAASVQTAINAWTAAGGADWPEGQLYALDQLATPVGGTIGWRPGAKRIIVWFGDAPGHDPVCAAISGAAADITEASVTAKLVAEQISVLAISTATPGLDGDPTAGLSYQAACGPAGGASGQASRIASATGGAFDPGVNPTNIVSTIINLVTTAVSAINNVSLVAKGATAPFVASISPAAGYGPLTRDETHVLDFHVVFKGIVPCKDDEQEFKGALCVLADGAEVAQKSVRIVVPACPKVHSYSVKFVCGTVDEGQCGCSPVRPGNYATDVTIHNYGNKKGEVVKRFIPLVFAGAPIGREPRSSGVKAQDRITLPPHSATFDDCCRITELLYGGKPASPQSLNIGFIEIESPVELAITAVYTVNSASGDVSLDVNQVQGRFTRPGPKSERGAVATLTTAKKPECKCRK